jgi:hypothetical protein
MPRQHLRKEHRESSPTPATLTPVGTEYTLPPLGLRAGVGRVIARKLAVAI